MNEREFNFYVKAGHDIVWQFVENEFTHIVQETKQEDNQPVFVRVLNFGAGDCSEHSLIYDESDELANNKGLHLKYWLDKRNKQVEYWNSIEPKPNYNPNRVRMYKIKAEKFKDHFYMVYVDYCSHPGFDIEFNNNSYEITQGMCSAIEHPVYESCPDQGQ
ncbi:hypothetical protein [Fundidesulfovibrio terrae]|uniref:hypothetical protein n=1 Tax=Fundidesulfovibrio terrae TaxID=2922866 RepID=UPI001FAF15EA|nr:hypothetical protein [Fundidesulfovibrio terrae]